MSQPILTYNLSWGPYNNSGKLSGKTYTDLNGNTVDCTYVDVVFYSSIAFTKFYATAVKDGNDYGFINDVLVDIRTTNPTGIKLYEVTNGTAATNYTFRINASSLLDGDGGYRIGLYVQQADGIWNYEYFFITSNNEKYQLSNGDFLQVPVKTN